MSYMGGIKTNIHVCMSYMGGKKCCCVSAANRDKAALLLAFIIKLYISSIQTSNLIKHKVSVFVPSSMYIEYTLCLFCGIIT